MDQSGLSAQQLLINAERLVAELEWAGRTLLALPNTGPTTKLVQGGMEWVRDASDHYAAHRTRIRPPIPDAQQISRMDQVLAWIPLIPPDKYVLRRIVGARCLVNPMTDRHLYTWRRLGIAIGADHKAVQRWHAQGIGLLVGLLNRAPSGMQGPPGPAAVRVRGGVGRPRAAAEPS